MLDVMVLVIENVITCPSANVKYWLWKPLLTFCINCVGGIARNRPISLSKQDAGVPSETGRNTA